MIRRVYQEAPLARKSNLPKQAFLFKFLTSLIPVIFLQGFWLVSGAHFSWSVLFVHLVFVLCSLIIFQVLKSPSQIVNRNKVGNYLVWGIVISGFISAGAYITGRSTAAAWLLFAIGYAFLISLDGLLSNGQNRLVKWVIHAFLAGFAGIASVALSQLESNFAEEEFFIAVQALGLGAFWLLLLWIGNLWRKVSGSTQLPTARSRYQLAMAVLLMIITVGGLFVLIRSYQHSFFPIEAPAYPGITREAPFLCGQAPPDLTQFQSSDIFQRILGRVEANPAKGTPEFGMLALGSGEQHWADQFRQSLLEESRAGMFTLPAQSVKFIQYEAALRLYYYTRLGEAFSGLFTLDEQNEIGEWFAAINRRAMTVEWVDWMYALAFGQLPEGPYENQENGAGLLALLEAENLADPSISPKNQAYLARNPRGWIARFRNTDDAIVYQPEWITNAYFQHQYQGTASQNYIRQSFEWLLLQSLPDGGLLRYNHPGSISLAAIAYLGAGILEDGRYVWLSGKSLDYLEAHQGYLFARPGIEQLSSLPSVPPTQGSCLLYGDSGLPNQAGPLAPDKIILRDGWEDDSTYLMLNLRFTGWHRYKGTNTVTTLYQAGPLLVEEFEGESVGWLPRGRSQFRDKRIPREILNGLVIERTGISNVLYTLTGIGGLWAQDPPYYAQVDDFESGPEVDSVSVSIKNWRGWDHRRDIYLYHQGPIVIVDEAVGGENHAAALVWHIPTKEPIQNNRIRIREGDHPAEVVLIPLGTGSIQTGAAENRGQSSTQEILYTGQGRLSLATVFLTGELVGADARIIQEDENRILEIRQGDQKIVLPLAQ